MTHQNKKPRSYRRITPQTVAEYQATVLLEGNGTAAVRKLEPSTISPKDRAWRIAKKSEQQSAMDFIDDQMQQIGIDAITRVGKMVNSSDERVATKNSHFIIDHLKGKAVQKSENKNVNINIESVLA